MARWIARAERPLLTSPIRSRIEGRGRSAEHAPLRHLVPLSRLVNAPVLGPDGIELGTVVDIVTRWDHSEVYPPVTGVILRIGRRRAWVPAEQIARITDRKVRLYQARVDLSPFIRRDGEVCLAAEVLDRQLIDVNGVRVLRAADLYLTHSRGALCLVGVDVGFNTLLRRLGLLRRSRPTKVIDWADVQAFGGQATRLTSAASVLTRLGPAELAELVERLHHGDQLTVLDALGLEAAADALEEMSEHTARRLLHGMEPARAAALLAEMEPDEAAESLRGMDPSEVRALLEMMDPDAAVALSGLTTYTATEAGGMMTTAFVSALPSDTVESVRGRVQDFANRHGDLDAVAVIDEAGYLVDDVRLVELFCAEPHTRLHELVRTPLARSVSPSTPVTEVARLLLAGRHSSIVVTDADGRPVGRVFADDLLDDLSNA